MSVFDMQQLQENLRKMPANFLYVSHRDKSCDEAAETKPLQTLLHLPGGVAVNWQCICGNFVRGKRYCPRCQIVRFRLENSPILDYWGMKLGTTAEGLPFNLPSDLLTKHTMISGQTGSGKTRFSMNLVSKVEKSGPKILIIDVEGEWKNIIPNLRKATTYCAVGKNLRINPFDLKDPGLIRELFRETVFKGIEKEYTDLSAQMNLVLQETINESNNIEELIHNIKSYDRQKLTALQKTKTALLVRLDPFLRSPLKEIFLCTKSNPDFSTIDEKNTVIDLHELDSLVAYNSELRLIYNIITIYFLRKMLKREQTELLTNVFVADEAQLLVPRILHKMIVTESWPATEFATRLRKRGCGIVLITQSPSNIERDIFKNTGTKISFRLQHQEDIKIIAESVGFVDPIEAEYLSDKFVRLPNKNAIVSTIGHEPFLITSDDFPVRLHEPETEDFVPEKADLPGPEEAEFLEFVKKQPFLSVRQRRKSLGWNDKKYSSVVDSLLKKKKIEIQKANLGRGAPVVLYQMPKQIPSVRHQFYVDWISKKINGLGFATKNNVKDGPDIFVPEINSVIEVELGTSDVHCNISRNTPKHKTVVVASDQKKLIESLRQENKRSNVLFLQIQNVPAFFEKMKGRTN